MAGKNTLELTVEEFNERYPLKQIAALTDDDISMAAFVHNKADMNVVLLQQLRDTAIRYSKKDPTEVVGVSKNNLIYWEWLRLIPHSDTELSPLVLFHILGSLVS